MDKNRVEAFSDGVFGFAATLLVVELRLPNGPSVHEALWVMSPKILAFVLSFLMVAMYWVAHHSMYHFVAKVDRSLLWLNNFTLLFVTFLPFPTAVLGNHPLDRDAIALYGATLIVLNTMGTLAWSYVARHPDLADRRLTPRIARQVSLLHLSPVAAYAIAIAAATALPRLSLAIFVAVPIFFIIPNRWVRTIMRSSDE
jgi:uncharacterized membrane protein